MSTIAVVDDDLETRLVIEKYLRSDGHEVITYDSGSAFIDACKISSPDLVLMDIEMPGLTGINTYDRIKTMKNMSSVPVVFLTGKLDKMTVLTCISKGAAGYLGKPVVRDVLVEKISEIFQKINEYKSNSTILIIDDDVEYLKICKHKLSTYYKVLTVDSGKSAIDYLSTHTVDLIMLDYNMPLYNGSNILNILKFREGTKKIPVVLVTEMPKEEADQACLKNLPDAYIRKPVDMDLLLEVLHKMIKNKENKDEKIEEKLEENKDEIKE